VAGKIFVESYLKKVFAAVYICTVKVKLLNIIQIEYIFFLYNIFKNVIYSCDAKLNFQYHYSSPKCHMILQKT